MSKYTSIILLIPRVEDEVLRIKEVNNYFLEPNRKINLRNLNDLDVLPNSTYAGTFNNFDSDRFIRHISENVNWEHGEFVQIIIQEEGARNCKIYSQAGKIILEESVMY